VKKSEWSDKELEELLMQMPKIKDNRHPRDIYQNLSLKKRKAKPWLLPGLAAAAALLLFAILVPKVMDGPQNYSQDAKQEAKSSVNKEMKEADRKESPIALKKDDTSANNEASSGASKSSIAKTDSIKTAIYSDDVGNGKVLTYWVPDPQAQILIPVSTIVTNDTNKSWLTLFNENMANLKEEEWGLSDFYPLNATMTLVDNDTAVQVDVPANHQYGQGSSNETSLVKIISRDIFSNSNIKKVKYTTNGQQGIEFGNLGVKQEEDITVEEKHAIFFYFPEGSDIPFLTPSVKTYTDINQALEAMKTDAELGLRSSLTSLLPLGEVSIADQTLTVSLNGNTALKDDQTTLSAFEALLLTAKEFGLEKVILKDSPITNLGPFDLTKATNVPVAPNMR
jgi:hypothetical protein